MRAIKKMDPKYSDYAEIVKKWKGKHQCAERHDKIEAEVLKVLYSLAVWI